LLSVLRIAAVAEEESILRERLEVVKLFPASLAGKAPVVVVVGADDDRVLVVQRELNLARLALGQVLALVIQLAQEFAVLVVKRLTG
jgi:hypothetical protein